MADPAPDDWLFNGPPVPAIAPAPAAAPVAQSLLPSQPSVSSQTPAPLPDEPGSSLIARAALAEGDQNNPDSWRGVAGVILNRMQKTGKTAAQVLSEPGQFESYQNGRIQSVDTSSPQFGAAMDAVKSTTAGPYDSFYQPDIVAQRGVKPPFDPSQGTKIGSQLFGNGYAGATSGAQPPPGLSDDQLRQWLGFQTPAATTPGGQKPDTSGQFLVGPNKQPATAAQAAWYKANEPKEGWSNVPGPGLHMLPYALQAGGPTPQTPGAEYVDLDGVHHVVPGGLPEMAMGAFRGLAQGAGADVANSIARLTGGGVAVGDPLAAAYAQSQGGPSAFDTAQASLQGGAQQQRDYSVQNAGNAFAQGGRFVGQAIPGTVAAAAVPELEAPAAFGAAGRLLAGAGTNALRGVAAVAPSVGANPQPVASQLAGGALAGVVLPPALKMADVAGSALTPSAAKIAPEVRDLADYAVNTLKIPLRGSQIAGTADPALAVKDSNLINAPGSGFAANHRTQLQAITRAVAGTFGANTDKLTPDVMSAARKNLGTGYDQFAASHSAPDVTQLHGDLDQTLTDARQVLPASELSPLENQVQNIKNLTAQNNGTLPGDTFQALTRTGSPLDRAMESKDSNIRYYAGQIHDALTGAVMQSATEDERAAFSNLNLQYKNLMTIKGLAAKADIQGAIPVKQLPNIVNRNFDRAFNDGGPLGKIADVVSTFMPSIPNSFTGQRAAEIAGRNWLPSALGGLAGASEFGMHDPATAMKLAAAAGITKGAQYGVNALEGLRLGAWSGLSLTRSPGAVGNALGNVRNQIEVPLSALVGAKVNFPNALGGFTGSGVGAAVGANAQ